MKVGRLRYAIPFSLALLSSSGCIDDNEPSSRDQAAGVMLTGTAVPWRQVASSLQPKFVLTADQATLQVAPVTQEASLAALQALGLSGSVGALIGPAASGSSSVSSPQAPTGIPTGAVLPTPLSPNTGLAVEPMLKYRAANALFQYVQLLNADLTSSFIADKYTPYIVHLKLTVTPYRVDLRYNLFARISFFAPACDGDAGYNCLNYSPKVVPLLVTDDVERAATSAAAESATQIAAALSVLAPHAQGSGSVNSVKELLRSVSGQNYDSLLTVGRVTDNTILARIGAAYQTVPSKGFGSWFGNRSVTTQALVGQNYDIITIVLVPREFMDVSRKRRVPGAISDTGSPTLSVNMDTDFRNTEDGSMLSHTPGLKFVGSIDKVVYDEFDPGTDFRKKWSKSQDSEKLGLVEYLQYLVSENKFSDFLTYLCTLRKSPDSGSMDSSRPPPTPCELDSEKQAAARRVWNRISATIPDLYSTYFYLDLPFVKKFPIPPQTVAVVDDGKTATIAQVQASSPAVAVGLLGILDMPERHGGTSVSIPSKSMSFDPDMGLLTITFPSVEASGFSKSVNLSRMTLRIVDPLCGSPGHICLGLKDTNIAGDRRCGTESEGGVCLPAVYAIAKGAPGPVPDFTVQTNAKQIDLTDSAGDGSIVVYFSKWGSELNHVISVDGADIKSANVGVLANGQVTVTKSSGAVTLSLTNLAANVPVLIKVNSPPDTATATLALVVAQSGTKTATSP